MASKANLDILIKGCIKRDRKSQKALYEQYFGLMLSISMRYVKSRDQAEDVVNQAFMKIFTKIKSYNGKGSFEGWMKKTLVNTCLDFLKSKKDFVDGDIEDLNSFDQKYYEVNDALSNLAVEVIIDKIKELPPMSRTVFNLYVLEDLKHKEISKKLGINEGTSHWHLQNAKKKLVDLLEQEQLIEHKQYNK